ncbi:hypothetical protein ACQP0C_15030 [Nocardia sp. CA-129566]|uniref:hypothetical protein n=1 Tax=Nocardia sp. CA-129566 TaxID=3239976 RepID=UPI003D97B785
MLGTLLHEAAHGVAVTGDIKDTSRQGRWHNTQFRELSEELGLQLDHDDDHGWSVTTVPISTRLVYRGQLDELDLALIAYRRRDPERPARTSSNGIAAICNCQRKIRVSLTTYHLGSISCGVCGSKFDEPRPE